MEKNVATNPNYKKEKKQSKSRKKQRNKNSNISIAKLKRVLNFSRKLNTENIFTHERNIIC